MRAAETIKVGFVGLVGLVEQVESVGLSADS
jgi:hypothetical protein